MEAWLTFFKIILIIGTALVALGTIGINILSHQLDKKKDAQITELVEGKNQLLEKITKYEEDLNIEKTKVKELENVTKVIQSIELWVFVNIKTPELQITDRGTTAGLSNAIVLFAKDKARYRFATDFQYTEQQVTSTLRRIELIYRPENPLQILGKQIDFLKNIEKFVCNYHAFLKLLKVDDGLGGSIDITVFLNGVDVITSRDLNFAPKVLSIGQAILEVSESFEKIPERYIAKIKEKSIQR